MATQQLVPAKPQSELLQGGVILPPLPEISLMESFKILEICEADMKEGESIVVSSPETFELAAQFGKKCGERMKAIKAFIRGTVPLGHVDNRSLLAMVDKVRTAITEFERDLLAPYETLDAKLKKEATAYRVEQQRIADAAAKTERERLQREADDVRIAQAERAASMGATTLADKLISTPVPVANVEAKSTIAKGFAGTKARKVWKFEITNRDEVPEEFWFIDEAKLAQAARDKKETANIPGVRVYSEDATSW